MDVRSCEAQGPPPRGIYASCGSGINVFARSSKARVREVRFSLDFDLHGCRLSGHNFRVARQPAWTRHVFNAHVVRLPEALWGLSSQTTYDFR